MTFFRNAWPLLKQTWAEFSRDNAMRLGAALAFYTALSLSPLLLLTIAIAGIAFGEGEARQKLLDQMRELTGGQGMDTVEQVLKDGEQKKGGGIFATVIGVVTLVVGAVGVFAALQDALNTVWNVDPKVTESKGIWGMVKDRLLSFSMVCGMAFLLLVSLVVSAAVGALNGVLNRWFPGAETVIGLVNVLVSAVVVFLMFAMIFKFLPHADVRWADVWVGAGITTVLFAVGKYLIGLYLGTAAVGSSFGAAGSFVVLLTWIYYSALILLFGAEFTQVYSGKSKGPRDPAKPVNGKAAGAGSPAPAGAG